MRIFVAVFPPAPAQDAAHGVIEALRHPGDGLSWVKRENLHYTLRFLGELGEDGARRVAEGAHEAAAAAAAFEAVLGPPGAFPSPERARVLWLGLAHGGPALEALAGALEAALRRRGFGRADRPFSAHLTIARVRSREYNARALLGAVKTLEDRAGARFTVGALSVVESTLSPRGSIYRVRAEAPLGGAAAARS